MGVRQRTVLRRGIVRRGLVKLSLFACALLPAAASAGTPGSKTPSPVADKPWCAPEVSELSDHVCFFEGPEATSGKRTLVIYLHGLLATTPGFQYLQQRGMALHAKRLGFTVLLPTSPKVGDAYVWPTSQTAQEEQEAGIIAGLNEARRRLEGRLGHAFDEVFVVGFSSGAYYASSLAVRGVLDVDGYIVLAGGSSWVRSPQAGTRNGTPNRTRRAPIFVGISAADPQTAGHSRAFAAALAGMGWPYRAEEREAGHMVDWGFMTRGIGWLRARGEARASQ